MKADPLNSKSQNQAKNIPVGLPSSPLKNLRQTSQGVYELWSDIKKEITTLHIDVHCTCKYT